MRSMLVNYPSLLSSREDGLGLFRLCAAIVNTYIGVKVCVTN